MAKISIPKAIQQEADGIIEAYNKIHFNGRTSNVAYFAETRGKFLYLKRKEYGKISPVARLAYTGDIKKWEFAIFKWTSEKYDPDEWFFPGSNLFDGTIEGAMKAGLEAYPV
jgi:hypothetical protein